MLRYFFGVIIFILFYVSLGDAELKISEGLQQFAKLVSTKYGKAFADCSNEQKTAWLTAIENKKDIPDEVVQFYQTTKQHTLQAFTSSKQYMVDVRKYNMVPGPGFKGCVPLKNKVV